LKEFLRCSAAISDRGVSEGCKIEDGEVDRSEEGGGGRKPDWMTDNLVVTWRLLCRLLLW
jgi:hypothetical protein